MNYTDCRNILLKLNDDITNRIENHLETEIDEIFIASADFNEMTDDLKNIHENVYGLSEIIPTSKNKIYSIYILDLNGNIHSVGADLFE